MNSTNLSSNDVEIYFANADGSPSGSQIFEAYADGSSSSFWVFPDQIHAAKKLIIRKGSTGKAFSLSKFDIYNDQMNLNSLFIQGFKGGAATASPLSAVLKTSGDAITAVMLNDAFKDVDSVCITTSGVMNDNSLWEGIGNIAFGMIDVPAVTWNNPADIVYGTALSSAQLNASCSVAGTFSYTPPLGTVPAVGSHDLKAVFTPNDLNSYSVVEKHTTLTVVKASPVLTWNSPAGITYGTALSASQLNAGSSISEGTFSYSPKPGTVLSSGEHSLTVEFTPTDGANYSKVSKTVTVTIAKAPLTVTAVNSSKAYGAAEPTLSTSITGFVNGENAAVLTKTPTVSREPGEDAKSYAITAAGAEAANYAISYVPGTFTIESPADPVITATVPAGMVYGTSLAESAVSANIAGTFAAVPAFGTVLPAVENSVTVTFTPNDKNYKTVSKTVTVPVAKAPLTVTAVNSSKAYGAAEPTLSTLITGFVNNENASVLTKAPTATREPGEDAKTYPITAAGAEAANYAISYVPGTFTIESPADPVITATVPAGMVYGTSLAESAVSANIAGTFSAVPAFGTVLPAGDNSVTVTFTPNDKNYKTVSKMVTVPVAKAPLTVTAVNSSKAYGSAEPTLSTSITGFVNGENAAVLTKAPTATREPGEDAKSYAITAAGAEAANYAISYVPGTFTIESPADPVITATVPAGMVYGSAFAESAVSANIAGTFSAVPAFGTVLGAGENSVTVTFTPNDKNYKAVSKTVTVPVAKAPLTVTAVNSSKAYGAAEPTLSTLITGFVNNENASVLTKAPTVSREPGEDAKTYAITAAGAEAANYAISYVPGTFTIESPADPVITAAVPAGMIYGQTLAESAVSANIAGTFSAVPAFGTVLPAGDNSVTVTFTPNDKNYKTVSKTVSVSVAKAPLTVTAAAASKVVGTADPILTYTITGFVNGETDAVVTVKPAITRSAGDTVGEYDITLSGGESANYTLNFVGAKFTIQAETEISDEGFAKADGLKAGIYAMENPVTGDKAELIVSTDGSSEIRVVILDPLGNLLDEQTGVTVTSGEPHKFNWNLCDRSGNPVGTGSYLAAARVKDLSTGSVKEYRVVIGVKR